MRILLCDFVGHAFPTELSRVLSGRGHEVDHVHLAGFVVGKGPLDRRADDPSTLHFSAIDLGAEFPKYRPVARAWHEVRFAVRLLRMCRARRSEVVLLSTTPPIAQLIVVVGLRVMGVPAVVWLQDLFAVAVESGGREALGRKAGLVTRVVALIERLGVRAARHVISISEAFRPFLSDAGVPSDRISVIPNWAEGSITPQPKDNPWSRQHGLSDVKVVLYAGTLGYKHDWTALLDLASAFDESSSAKLVVVSEGEFTDRLRVAAGERGLGSLVVLPFQPFECLPDVLATADVCLALLTDDASQFSVPSKVQSYLAAGRPVLLAGPVSGDAARAITESGAGSVVDIDDHDGLTRAALALLEDPGSSRENARRYAVEHFDAARKAGEFESVLRELVTRSGR